MEEWELFLQRSGNDLKMSKLCYENSDFELSSYLIQQSLEKSIKAFLLKKKVVDDPEELKHLPLHRIFSLLKEDLKKRKKRHQNQKHLLASYENCILLIGKMTTLFDDIRKSAKKSQTKIRIWKESLGIPLTQDEKKVKDYWRDMFQPDTERIIRSLHKFTEGLTEQHYDKIAKDFGVSKE
ncbi:MAG: HEPN domain-containing protein, partial [Candidatus Nitrosotenuis sp.]|nr:HEPN domain-containing protein [Candidatus Nitrosotenuis sp.]